MNGAEAVNQNRSTSDAPVALDLDRRAHIVYTSGTTGRPKGVVHTHAAVEAQVVDLVEAWGWRSSDRILHFLPLHHTHGIVNKLCCPLWCGATVEFMPRYSPDAVWERLSLHLGTAMERPWITVLMGVPTVYAQLIESYERMVSDGDVAGAAGARAGCKAIRLMVSGSAALPISVLEKWEEISGTVLLERYGMTEFAMALSNPLERSKRAPGYVGVPLPSVQVTVCAVPDEEDGSTSSMDPQAHVPVLAGESGELRVKGAGVFREYLNKPEATAETFDHDGWFMTGDIGRFDVEGRGYQILGRASVDIIKSAGYKLSALEIERAILEHKGVAEVSVVGVEDEKWGQRVCALVRLREGNAFRPADVEDTGLGWLKDWLGERVAPYRVPSTMLGVDSIPKNVMGKVNKKALAKEFFGA